MSNTQNRIISQLLALASTSPQATRVAAGICRGNKILAMDHNTHLVQGSLTDTVRASRIQRFRDGEKVLKTEAFLPDTAEHTGKNTGYYKSENEIVEHLTDESVGSSLFRGLVGVLLWISRTRPDISAVVSMLSQHLTDPRTSHWTVAKRVLSSIDFRGWGERFAVELVSPSVPN